MSTDQLTKETIDLPLRERVSLAQRLWERIEQGVVDAEERQVVAEAVQRDEELTSGVAVGREHGEVMQTARQRLRLGAFGYFGQADQRTKGRRQTVKTLNLIKKPFGEASFSPIRHARYLGWEDAFEVEFEDGLCFLEPHEAIRQANRIAASDRPVVVAVDSELHSHFTVTYESGARVEVSWSFVRENAPAETIPTARVAEAPQG